MYLHTKAKKYSEFFFNRDFFAVFRKEMNALKLQLEELKAKELAVQTGDVGAVVGQLEKKHAREMDELRLFFEKQCADQERRCVKILHGIKYGHKLNFVILCS